MSQARSPFSRSGQRAFSLVELLLAVFILGIGIIGISALFPAGIAQQRQANDDIMGPIVADHAMALLRSRLKPESFGTMEEFAQGDELFPNGTASAIHRYTVPGDWEWKRPGFLFTNNPASVMNKIGAIDIFSAYATAALTGGSFGSGLDLTKVASENLTLAGGGDPMYGIPYNKLLGCPIVLFSQAERSYPVVAPGADKVKRPAFFWECMFRRFAGRIQVAVFVYRVVDGGGEPREYIVSQATGSTNTIPPLPVLADLSISPFVRLRPGGWDGVTTTIADNAVAFRLASAPASPAEIISQQTWQNPGQWILDEYNSIHRVMTGRRTSKDLDVILSRPVPAQPPLAEFVGNTFAAGATNGSIPADPGARFIWFMPTFDAKGFSIVPVFVTVQEL